MRGQVTTEGDKELLEAAGRGDEKAFERIYLAYKDDMLTVAVWLLGEHQMAEDVVHEIFVSLAGFVRRLKLRSSLKNYLLTTCVNRARDVLRSRERERRMVRNRNHSVLNPANPVEMVILDEECDRAVAALGRLPIEQREVVALRIHGQITFREISRLLRISVNTAQSRYRYALSAMKLTLSQEGVSS